MSTNREGKGFSREYRETTYIIDHFYFPSLCISFFFPFCRVRPCESRAVEKQRKRHLGRALFAIRPPFPFSVTDHSLFIFLKSSGPFTHESCPYVLATDVCANPKDYELVSLNHSLAGAGTVSARPLPDQEPRDISRR